MPMDLHQIGQEYCALYTQQPLPTGDPIQSMVTFSVSDEIPDKSEIVVALRSLQSGRAPGASGMIVEDLKKWYADWEAHPEPWLLVLQLVMHTFQMGVVPT